MAAAVAGPAGPIQIILLLDALLRSAPAIEPARAAAYASLIVSRGSKSGTPT